jgi:protoporphyrinogen oxidase
LNYDVIIIGAGPAGLSAAYELAKNDKKVLVLEENINEVGGLCRKVEYDNFIIDIGGHRFFSKNREIENMWTEIMGEEILIRKRFSRIFYNKKFYDYPLDMANVIKNLGFFTSFACFLDFLYIKLFPIKNELSFEDWVINHFGKRLYNMFFKTYTEKAWGVKCGELNADFAAQRIRYPSLLNAALNSIKSLRSGDKKKLKILMEGFYYPKLGPGQIWERLKELIIQCGGNVLMGRKVIEIKNQNGRVIEVSTSNGAGFIETFSADHFISSMPLRSFINSMRPEVPETINNLAKNLNYRDFITVFLIVNSTDLFPDNWIYIHDPSVKLGRIQNYKNWSPYLVPNKFQTSLGLEYFCFEGDSMWTMQDSDLIKFGIDELEKINLAKKEDIVGGCVIRVTKAYPIYSRNYREQMAAIKNFLKKNYSNLQIIGRNGMHKYINMDHAMMTGILAAKNIIAGNYDKYDIWEVNEDAKYLEERIN